MHGPPVENCSFCFGGRCVQSDAVSHRLCRGVENPHLDREFWEYEMPEQANVHQITTTGFPPPSPRCGGARWLLRRGTLFSCQSSDGTQNGPLRSAKEVDSEQIDNFIPSCGNVLSSFFFSPGVPKRHFFEWTSLAENRWPSSGRKLTPHQCLVMESDPNITDIDLNASHGAGFYLPPLPEYVATVF